MKNKPQKHKASNTFKFKSFGDRITEVDVRRSALYHIEHANEANPEETGQTHFHEAVEKWSVLNLTEEYDRFQKQIRNVVSLPQLIHRKQFVVDVLLESLDKATTLSLQPLLEFVIVLAKDLREDFYPFFPRFLAKLIALLETKDADQLEWTLISLAFLFKTLKSFLKKDISVVFSSILPLLDDDRPEHVTNFAAECFSFVSRDIKDKSKFLTLVLRALKKNEDRITGCGRLFFEIVRGTNGRFHSCASEFFTLWFNALLDPNVDQKLLFAVVTQTVTDALGGVDPKHTEPFWSSAYTFLTKTLKTGTAIDERTEKAVECVLHLIGQAVEFRDGKCFSDPAPLIRVLMLVCDAVEGEAVLLLAASVVSVLLQMSSVHLTQLDASLLAKKILRLNSAQVFESFVWNTVLYSQFEIQILPDFLRYFEQNFSERSLELLAKIIANKAPLARNGLILDSWKVYPINLKKAETLAKLEEYLVLDDTLADVDNYLFALTIYPHILSTAQTHEAGVSKLENSYVKLLETILLEDEPLHGKEPEAESENKKVFYVVSVLLETLVHLKNADHILKTTINSVLPYCSSSKYAHCLRILDLCTTAVKQVDKSCLDENLFGRVHASIADNLASPYSEVRLLTAHILCQFPCSKSASSPYRILLEIEEIIPTIQTYRDQLLLLQKITPGTEISNEFSKQMQLDCLRYALGLLHVNFRLLWEPISKMVVSYSNALPTTDFWMIFHEQLKRVTEKIRLTEKCGEVAIEFLTNTLLREQFVTCWTLTGQPDSINYRIMLWRVLRDCGSLVQVKNREIVGMFLDFIETEYRSARHDARLYWNVLKRNENDEDDGSDDDEVAENENENENEHEQDEGAESDHETGPKVKKARYFGVSAPKATQKTLIALMSAFAGLTNPTQVYRQSDLYAVYVELLAHKNFDVQKSALDAIMAYKYKYLTPYKDHLYNVLDDKKLKEALLTLKLDKESSSIAADHRSDFVPILMCILYGKLTNRSGGRGTYQAKRTMILRYLGLCSEPEVVSFANMVFKVFELAIQNRQCTGIRPFIADALDLTNVISPKKLQSVLGLIELMRNNFGGLIGNAFLSYLFKILVAVGATAVEVLTNEASLSPANVNQYKKVAAGCLSSIVHMFEHFDAYPWTGDEIDVVFDVFVWPGLGKLPTDSIHSPTQLLKLFITWTNNKRYHVLLAKHAPGDKTTYALPHIIRLLENPQCKAPVFNAIMDMIEKLISLNDEHVEIGVEEESTVAGEHKAATATGEPILISDMVPVDAVHLRSLGLSYKLNFGATLLLPFIDALLEKIKQSFGHKTNVKEISKRELFILSRTTQLVTDAATCANLVALLLPILVKRTNASSSETIMTQMVGTLSNLFKKLDSPEQHIRNVAPLFELITAVGPRKLLCKLVQSVCEKRAHVDPSLTALSHLIGELNAWDRKWIEQPDYERRLGAYRTIGDHIKTGTIDMNTGLIVVYHSFYFLRYDKDLAMRDTSSYHLRAMIPALAAKYKSQPHELDYLIGSVILNIVQRAIRDKKETMRYEGIQLLGDMARECPDAHPILRDLHPLTNKLDREVDFFDNITHLQVYRHGRALHKFTEIARTYQRRPAPRALTQFILPIASLYVCTETYAQKHTIVDAAIDVIGTVCRFLPWHQYETVLKFYLKRLRFSIEYQRQLVRIITAILDGFHFDLSNAQDTVAAAAGEIAKAPPATPALPAAPTPLPDTVEEAADLDEVLDTALDEIADKDVEEEAEPAVVVLAFDRITVLSVGAAKRLIHGISTSLIPTLNRSITERSIHDTAHKVNRHKKRSQREEEELMRVPVAFAIVKLLQKLPAGMLDRNIHGVFMKVCTFLKSPIKSVRMAARDIMRKIMIAIGPAYLDTLLEQMTALLTRGFQVHVLSVTVHNILEALRPVFRVGDIDRSLQRILDVTLEDIFGRSSEEKTVDKIAAHTPEARPSNKSFQILTIAALHITETCLVDLLMPFKEHLERSRARKIVTKVQDCFARIISGLVENQNISAEALLIFIYGTASESIPELCPGAERVTLTDTERAIMQRTKPDCYLIPEAPRTRAGAVRVLAKTNRQTNAHVLVEFGLDMLHMMLKRGKLSAIAYAPFLNPLVCVMLDALRSKHVRVTIYALKCLTAAWNKKLEVTALETSIDAIASEMFLILHKYVTVGGNKNDENYHLVKNAFKATNSLIRTVSYYSVTEEQLRTLLLYVEQDLNDFEKQSNAFALLKAIVSRKLIVKEMQDVMKRVSEVSVTSESNVVREESRTVLITYFLEYPLGDKINRFIKFYVKQMSYEMISGRESAIKMLATMFRKFPTQTLNQISGYIYISLGARLVNELEPDLRRQIAETLEMLLTRIDKDNRNKLFDILLVLLDDKKVSHKEMAAQLCTRFVNANREEFESRVVQVLPKLAQRLMFVDPNAPGRCVRVVEDDDELDVDETNADETIMMQKQRAKDHQLIQMTNAILVIFENYPSTLTTSGDLNSFIDEIAYQSQNLLGYEHNWVRLNAIKILAHILSASDTKLVDAKLLGVSLPDGEVATREFLYSDPIPQIKSLALDLCAQLIPDETEADAAEEVCKCLLYMANMLKNVPIAKAADNANVANETKTTERRFNVLWLIRRLRYAVHAEIAKAPHSCVLRTAVFNWIEGFATLASGELTLKVAPSIMAPLVREMSDEYNSIDETLRQHALKVGTRIRKRIGDNEYNTMLSKLQGRLMTKRAERKKSIAQERINYPVRAAKRKEKQQQNKNLAKKRKMDVIKGKVAPKKKRKKFVPEIEF